MNTKDHKDGYYSAEIYPWSWIIPEYYQNLALAKYCGDFYGCTAEYSMTGEKVIIRKLDYPRYFSYTNRKKRFKTFYMMLYLLQSFEHENILDLFDLFMSFKINEGEYLTYLTGLEFIYINQVYLVSNFDSVSLEKCYGILTNAHIQYIVYQMLCVLKYLHSAGIICKRLMPRDFIICENCDIKLLPFELTFDDIEYVRTMYCRCEAPELFLKWGDTTPKADIWSIGCIMAEIITGKPLFPFTECGNWLELVTSFVGSFDDEKLLSTMPEVIRNCIRRQPKKERKNFAEYFSTATSEAVDFLEKALVVDSDYRMSVDEALAHPYFSAYHDPAYEPTRDRIEIDTNDYSDEEWKEKLFNLINDFQEKKKTELKPYFDSNGEYYCLKMKPQEKLIL